MLSIPWDICSVCNLNYFISRLFISMVFWKGLESLLMDFMIMSYWANPRQILFWLYLLYLLRGDYIPYKGWCLSQSDRFLCFRVLWREEDGTSNVWLNLLKMWFFFNIVFQGGIFLGWMKCITNHFTTSVIPWTLSSQLSFWEQRDLDVGLWNYSFSINNYFLFLLYIFFATVRGNILRRRYCIKK